MELIINDNFIIDDFEAVQQKISELYKILVDKKEMLNFINEEKNTAFCFDPILSRRNIEDKDSYYVWVDTGYLNHEGEAIFISLIKREKTLFTGYFVGTAKYLFKGICSKYPNYNREIHENFHKFQKKYEERVVKRTKAHLVGDELVVNRQPQVFNLDTQVQLGIETKKGCVSDDLTDVTEEIYNNLLFPMWQSIEGLNRYIKIIGKRIEQLVQQEKTEYYIKNNIGSVVVNSGLINMLGRDYLIQYRYNEKYKTYIAYNILEGKKEYLENGYSKEQTAMELKPISFFDKIGDERMNATFEDFDVSQHSLMHIIEERRERFPENLQDEPSEILVTYLFNALQRGIRILQRDTSYVKPTYSGESGSISWLMPFHIRRKLIEEPELVIVIRKVEEFYEIKTILPYDNGIKDRITALSLYSKIW